PADGIQQPVRRLADRHDAEDLATAAENRYVHLGQGARDAARGAMLAPLEPGDVDLDVARERARMGQRFPDNPNVRARPTRGFPSRGSRPPRGRLRAAW